MVVQFAIVLNDFSSEILLDWFGFLFSSEKYVFFPGSETGVKGSLFSKFIVFLYQNLGASFVK